MVESKFGTQTENIRFIVAGFLRSSETVRPRVERQNEKSRNINRVKIITNQRIRTGAI